MLSQFQEFKALHQSEELFILPNAWNAKSAVVFEKNGFHAIGTSSAAIASSLGYGDGEEMAFDEYLFVIRRILSSVQIPVTIDVEMGYGKTKDAILGNILKLVDLGVSGINIEDSIINGTIRSLQEAKVFSKTIEYIKNKMESKNPGLFINIRCDTYILDIDNKREETKSRVRIYEAAGADGIFLPCISNEDDIAEVTASTRLPLNVMCVPGLPGFSVLNDLGVKRVSMGPFLFNKVYDTIEKFSLAIKTSESFSPILS